MGSDPPRPGARRLTAGMPIAAARARRSAGLASPTTPPRHSEINQAPGMAHLLRLRIARIAEPDLGVIRSEGDFTRGAFMRRGSGKPLWLLLSTTMAFGVAMPLMQAATAVSARAAGPPHILELMEENESYGSIIGSSSAPYINSLAGKYALATNWSSNEHVSWKDYNIAVGGSDFGKQSGIPASNKNIANELDNMGTSWKGYMESMPSACDTSSSGNYDAGHDPFVHFLSITNNSSECKNNVVPYTQSGMVSDLNNGSPPAFVWVTPNQCDDMHSKCGGSNPIKVGDTWLSNFIPAVQSTNWYQSGGIIILTWDEAATSDNSGCCGDPGGGHVATLVISANSSGHFTSVGDHDGTLHAIEAAYGVGFLGASGSGHGDLTGAFGSPPQPGTISGTVTDANTTLPIAGATVSCTCSGSQQTTDGSGNYQFSNVTPNTSSNPYSVTFLASGFQPQTVNTVVVSSGGTTTVDQALTPGSNGTISGTVTNANNSTPIQGATVSCTCSGTQQTTDINGNYQFSNVTPNNSSSPYSMTFSAATFQSQTINNVLVPSGGTTTESAALIPTSGATGSITGLVTNSAGGSSLAGVTVTCSCNGGANTVTTGNTPTNYSFSNVAVGNNISLTFSDTGFATQIVSNIVVTTGNTTTVNVAMVASTGPPKIVQHPAAVFAKAAVTSFSIATGATTAGDLLAVTTEFDGGSGKSAGSVVSVTDNKGDTWTRATAVNPSTRIGVEVWDSPGAAAGVTSVTVTYSTSVNPVLEFYELSNATSLDKAASAAGTGTSLSSGLTGATSTPNEFVIGEIGFVSTTATISGLSPGFTNGTLTRNPATNFNNSEQGGNETVTATGTFSYAGTLSGSQAWAAAVATFM